MSTLEILFWNVLGYATMAAVFIVGFAITALIACFVLDRMSRGEEQ